MKTRLEKLKKRLFLPLMGFLALLVALSPFLTMHAVWRSRPERTLDIVAIDKTCPMNSYREHLGLYWLLSHRKIKRPEGGDYRLEWDYYGYHPIPPDHYQLRELPDDLGYPDLLWAVDTYGVYEEDIDPGVAYMGRHSRLIYGGATVREATALARAFQPGSTLIMEFNSFATPTQPAARRAMEYLVGVQWTGWTGRYFPNLADKGEVPVWVRELYERNGKAMWGYDGPGYVFVHVNGRIVVLREPEDVAPSLPRVRFTPEALERYDPDNDVPYCYWFDIVKPAADAEVIAEHHLDVTDKGRNAFKEAGLPTQFPAVVRRNWSGRTSYYFAGDFSDVGDSPDSFRIAGTETFFRTFAWWPTFDPQTFYWKVYAPLVGTILEETIAARARRVNPRPARVRGAQYQAGKPIPKHEPKFKPGG